MKNLSWRMWPLLGGLVLTVPMEMVRANPLKIPAPDPGLLAAVDVQADQLEEGIVFGDFETWYPGLYPDYRWVREITEIGSKGLFRVDYAVFHARERHRVVPRELSLLLFRPESPPVSASAGVTVLAPTAGLPGGKFGPPVVRAAASTRAVKVIENALLAGQMFAGNARDYIFVGGSQSVSFVSRLPDSFPGAQSFGGAHVRRVSFYLQPGRGAGFDLVVEHAPLLLDTRQVEPYRTTLAEDVSVFHLQYWDAQAGDWTEQWNSSNSIPRMVQVTLGLGKSRGRGGKPHELVSRIVALPAVTVAGDLQGQVTSPPTITNLPPKPPSDWPPNPHGRLSLAHVGVMEDISEGVWGAKFQGRPEKPALPEAVRRHSKFERAYDVELQWLGLSAVELARYILSQGSVGIAAIYDALNQKWAGGPGDANSGISGIPMDNYSLGDGTFSIKITDLDRKFNINTADEVILRQALVLLSVDAAAIPGIVDSMLDWRDPDSARHPMGAEGDDYLIDPNFVEWPYFAKDGPIDDLTELLLVRGVTPAMFWGGSSGSDATFSPRIMPASQSQIEESVHTVGLVDLFTPLSGGRINVNTASATALQVLPYIDENVARAILQARAGPDGVEGNEDDTPFHSPQELAYRVPGIYPAGAAQLSRYFTVRSLVFEVNVEAATGGETRHFVALLRRNNPRDVQVLNFYPE